MKRIIASITLVASLALMGLAIPTAASAQTTQTQTAQTHSSSQSQPDYVGYCLSAIISHDRDTAIVGAFQKLGIPKGAKIYDLITKGSDAVQLTYEWQNHDVNVIFSASRVVYDIIDSVPGTSPFWAIGVPATSCLQAAFIFTGQAGYQIGGQLRKDLLQYLPGLLAPPAAPTGLAVHADPSNGTVLLLTWQDNANNETAFEVNNGDGSRSASASPGTGTVHYTWTGLKPGSWTCFRVRATNGNGASNWGPNAAPWYTCAYSSGAQTSKPTMSVSPSSGRLGDKFTISGKNWVSGGTLRIELPYGSKGWFVGGPFTFTVPANGSWDVSATVSQQATAGSTLTSPPGVYVFTASENQTKTTASYTVLPGGQPPTTGGQPPFVCITGPGGTCNP